VSVVEALGAVMADVQGVGKKDRNTAQNFSFRGIDAVVNAVGPALRTHGVIIAPTATVATSTQVEVGKNRTLMREVSLLVTFTAWGPDGDSIDVQVAAESMDSGDKATAKAHSVAYRTALLQLLCIPTDEPDPDATSYERAAAGRSIAAAKGELVAFLSTLGADDPKATAATVWRRVDPSGRSVDDDTWADLLEAAAEAMAEQVPEPEGAPA
jgi:hypothetical protein